MLGSPGERPCGNPGGRPVSRGSLHGGVGEIWILGPRAGSSVEVSPVELPGAAQPWGGVCCFKLPGFQSFARADKTGMRQVELSPPCTGRGTRCATGEAGELL